MFAFDSNKGKMENNPRTLSFALDGDISESFAFLN